MKTRKFLIARGNSTALVSDCSIKMRKIVSSELLKQVEQVGFISKNNLIMSGGELCINATLAFASILEKKGILYTAGIKAEYKNINDKTIIRIPLNYKRIRDIILFNGIGFICINKKVRKIISREYLSSLCGKYSLPAFGAIVYNKNKIRPYVYVKQINSFVKETACGSGSIAYSLFSRYKKIVQPTKKVISIKIKRDKILVSAEVKETIWKTN